MGRHGDTGEDTPLTNRAFRSKRGIVEGLALLVAGGLAMAGLSACGAPSYKYVADSPHSTYYKVPQGWDPLSSSSLTPVIQSQLGNLDVSGTWYTAYDANKKPSADDFLSFQLSKPFVAAEVIPLPTVARDVVSYNALRDFMWPVTSTARQNLAASGLALLSNFSQYRDDTITAKDGVHGVRETFQYAYQGASDVWDEEILTNADQTVVYFLVAHCKDSCYSQNLSDINTVMSSFTIGS
jgi:hypothetical protein